MISLEFLVTSLIVVLIPGTGVVGESARIGQVEALIGTTTLLDGGAHLEHVG